MTKNAFAPITGSELDTISGGKQDEAHPWRDASDAANYDWDALKKAYGKTGAKFFIIGTMLQ